MQYTLTDTWQAVTATTGDVSGTIYNCGGCDVEISAEAEPVNGTGILLRSGTTLQYNKPVKARTYDDDDAGRINVESFNTAASGGTGGGYTLPAATTSELGGVIVGDNLSIDDDGVLSADTQAHTVHCYNNLSALQAAEEKVDGNLAFCFPTGDATHGYIAYRYVLTPTPRWVEVPFYRYKATTMLYGAVLPGKNINFASSSATISVNDASTSQKGVVKIGDNIDIDDATISIADASATKKGVVQIGDGLKLDANGKLTLDIGDGLTIDANGKLTRTQNTTDTDIEHLFYEYQKATGTYVAGTTYYTDDTGATEVDTTDFVEGVTDVSEYYIKVYL